MQIKTLQLIEGFSSRWCRLSESNQQPIDYKSIALPIELRRHYGGHYRDRTCDLFRVKEAFSR